MKILLVRLACVVGLLPATTALFAQPTPAATPTPTPAPAAIDGIVRRPNLFKATVADLRDDLHALQFRWNGRAKDVARSVIPGLTLAGRPLTEALLRFDGDRLSEITLFYFSRGDVDAMNEDDFEQLVADVTSDLTALTGKSPEDRGRNSEGAVRAEGRAWELDSTEYLLEWSATEESRSRGIPYRAEFIRLTIQPRDTTVRAIGAPTPDTSIRAAVKKFTGSEHIEHLPDGTVWLKDVPMVDQGDKGYCVVASVERVLRYYGADVDQYALAQMAGSDAAKGTNPDAMFDSLKNLTARLGVKAKSHYDWDLRDFLKLIRKYNRATHHGNLAPEIDITGRMIDISECYAAMKPEILREVRMRQKSDYGRFRRDIKRNIDEGIPLLWSVQIGLVPEKGIKPGSHGGHMRLIIGYNEKTKEIVYTDSWGMGHERKTMSMDDAWLITSALYTVEPIGS